MRLVTHGCSFTYGEELSNASLAWPYILADKIGAKVTNLAQPGYSNDAMIQDLLKEDLVDSFVIVAWTSYLRVQMVDKDGWFTISPGKIHRKKNDNEQRVRFSELAARLIDEGWLYERWLTHVVLLQSYLKQHDIDYRFINTFDNQKHIREHELLTQIDTDKFIGWPHDGIVEWAYPCSLGPRGHPLEDGHQKIAETLYEHVDYKALFKKQ